MMRSMFAAISGLKVHQAMMDVAANDISNVNTIGYKGSRVSFKDALAQQQRSSSAPTNVLGGTNPVQLGLGVQINSVDSIMTTGGIQATGNPLDMAIQGDGLFRVASYDTTTNTFGQMMYTRAGNFTRDSNGNIVTPEGYYLVGNTLDAGGNPTTTQTRLQIPTTAKQVTIGQDGKVNIIDAAGNPAQVGVVTLAKFPNDAGLDRVSGNRYAPSNNSGSETAGTPGVGGLGTIIPSSVEMSNIDLAQEFTTMITAQRGFQANSRIISAADEMLQELVNLKR
jgi:flagellar hook protein FlgE